MGVCGWAPQAKEERLAEEKAKKKAAAKKMGEVEARRRQEDEARRLRWLQQVRTPGSRSRRTALPPCPWTAGLTPLCRVDLDGSCCLELTRKFNKGHGGGDGGGDPPCVFRRGSNLRVKCVDSGARLTISVLPSISCVTLGGLFDLSVLWFLQVAVVSTRQGCCKD